MDWSAAIIIVQAAIILYLSISHQRLSDRLDDTRGFLRLERSRADILARQLSTTAAERDFFKASIERAAEHAA